MPDPACSLDNNAAGSADGAQRRDYRRMTRRDFVKGITVVGSTGVAVYAGRYLIPPSPRFSYRTAQRSLNHVVPADPSG